MNFPFARDQFYSIGLLRSFAPNLSEIQAKDPALCTAMRSRQLPGAKLWSEELWPLLIHCDYDRLPDKDEFKIMPEGHRADAELRTRSGEITRFQITTAYRGGNAPVPGGYTASIERQAINQGTPVFLGGTEKVKNGLIISTPVARAQTDDCSEWQSGLMQAIKNKISNSAYHGIVDCPLCVRKDFC